MPNTHSNLQQHHRSVICDKSKEPDTFHHNFTCFTAAGSHCAQRERWESVGYVEMSYASSMNIQYDDKIRNIVLSCSIKSGYDCCPVEAKHTL